MDAQNAADTDQTKRAGSPPKQLEQHESSDAKSPKSAPKAKPELSAHEVKTDRPMNQGADSDDSDAETVVLPGKDGFSPSKVRKVRQEDRSDNDGEGHRSNGASRKRDGGGEQHAGASRSDGASRDLKKKRPSNTHEKDKDRSGLTKDGSSGLSSAPTSPRPHPQPPRRRSINASLSLSDSEDHRHKPAASKTSLRDKFKSGERLLSHKRKAPRHESDDDDDNRKARRPRTISATMETIRPSKEHRGSSKNDPNHRSTSPPHRTHGRSASTQLPSQSSNGSAPKKKRVPAPLYPPEDNSDESSTSGSPHLRNAKLRGLTTPSAGDSLASPAKIPSHKKHLDAHGQTLLARACARGEYDAAKSRLKDRPEDLNVADYAGNTPLQIAAINGCEDIVQLLIEAGCNLDCVNYDKDTPLLDAVDNGHLGVVKLLLEAGVNPRKANVNGEEPIDRVTDETDNADEIRVALVEAKKRFGGRTKTSEDRHSHHDSHEQRDSHAPDSPRQQSAQANNRRGGTVRSTKTRNDLLYMPLDDKTLRQAAGRGDEETVARILQVKENCDDAESMVAAARGGHDLVMQLLLGLGGAKADPDPVVSQPEEFATPILAAIGQENLNVVELLLEQQNFDPTRRFKGETYYEIARRRQGTNWKEEEQLLKNAYDAYKTSHKSKLKSPGKRDRDREREEKRARREERTENRLPKRRNSSPAADGDHRRKPSSSAKLPSPRELRKLESQTLTTEEARAKRGPARPKEDKLSSLAVSDREGSPSIPQKAVKTKRAESDLAAMSSEGETAKPRRKLISKGELRGERDKRDKQRRPSMASNPSLREPSSPHDSRHDETTEKPKLSEKYHDRAKALKRDESRDRPAGSGDGTAKRHRASLTPDRSGNGDKDDGEKPAKRQRLDGDALERKQKRPLSDDHGRKPLTNPEGSKLVSKNKRDSDDLRASHASRDASRKDSHRHSQIQDTIQIKSEDIDVEMINVDQGQDSERVDEPVKDQDAMKKKAAMAEKAREEDERRRIEAEEEKARLDERKRQEEKKQLAEAESARKLKEAEDAERARKLEEQRVAEQKRLEEEEEARRQAEEKARRAAEEQARRDAEEAKRKQEEEEANEKRRQAEEQKKREEEEEQERERLRKERELEEESRRKEEEEQQRREREHRERLQREEMERKRTAREAEQRRIREEQDRARLDKLPPLLQWLDTCSNPKKPYLAEKFKTMQGVRYDCINTVANHTEEGREQWVLNTHVALLLGEKDLSLSRYTSWERAPVSGLAKKSLWRIENGLYSLTADKMLDLGQQLPGYYGDEDANRLSHDTIQRLRRDAWDRFRDLDMFFVKVSDLLYTIPTIPHLQHLKIAVTYRELLETEEQARFCRPMQKWKQDPDADRLGGHFAPRNKYYIDGRFVDEDKPVRAETSKIPFPDPPRVPRRGGLAPVMPDESDYERLCMEQGLEHLVNGKESPSLPNGVYTPPASHSDAPTGVLSTETGEAREHGGMEGVSTETHHSTINGGEVNGINGAIP